MTIRRGLPKIGMHGGDIREIARSMGISPEDMLDFSTNCNIFAHELTKELVDSTPYDFAAYPENDCAALRACIAEHENIPENQIIIGNGSVELIFLTLRTLNPGSVLLIGPIFSEYALACEALGIPYTVFPLSQENGFCFDIEHIHAIWKTNAELAVFCSPNNPGGAADPNIKTVLERLPCPRLLFDHTYKEFLWGNQLYESHNWNELMNWARPGASVITLNSFTKFFYCAGIRLGYAICSRTMAGQMRKFQPPWMITNFAQTLGELFLKRIDDYRDTLPILQRERAHMARNLGITGLFAAEYILEGPSFLCLGLQPGFTATEIRDALLQRRILIRACDNIPGMPPGYIRIQVRPAPDAERLYEEFERLGRTRSCF